MVSVVKMDIWGNGHGHHHSRELLLLTDGLMNSLCMYCVRSVDVKA